MSSTSLSRSAGGSADGSGAAAGAAGEGVDVEQAFDGAVQLAPVDRLADIVVHAAF
jgi:hypothetical protein